MNNNPQINDDPFDSATSATTLPAGNGEFYGQVQLDVWYCILQKGVGKVVYDPAAHRLEDRRTALDLIVAPLAEHNMRLPIQRQMIAESDEWVKHTWASARALGITNARELNNSWVKITFDGTGRMYDVKDRATGQLTGEQREAKAIKFLAFYPSEEACHAAYEAERGIGAPATPQATQYAQAAPAKAVNLSAQTAAVDGDRDRTTALAFLGAYVKNATLGRQLDEARAYLGTLIAAQPIIAKFFTVDSPETVDLLVRQYAK